MMRHDPLLDWIDHFGLALEARHDPVDRVFEIARLDTALACARGSQRRLIHQVGEVRPDEAWGSRRYRGKVDTRRKRDVPRMYAEDLLPPTKVGPVDDDLPVESSRTEQGRIQNLWAVGGRHEDHALLRVEPVHLGEQLIQRLLAFVVTSHDRTHATGLAERIEFVDEDDARRVGLGLREEVAQTMAEPGDVEDEIRGLFEALAG